MLALTAPSRTPQPQSMPHTKGTQTTGTLVIGSILVHTGSVVIPIWMYEGPSWGTQLSWLTLGMLTQFISLNGLKKREWASWLSWLATGR